MNCFKKNMVLLQKPRLDTIVDLVDAEMLDKSLAMDVIQTIRTRYPPAFVEHTKLLLQR